MKPIFFDSPAAFGARQEATRARRLAVLIETAARGVHMPPLKLLDRSRPAPRKATARRAPLR